MIVDSAGMTLRLSVRFDPSRSSSDVAIQAASGELAMIQRKVSAGSMRRSRTSSSMARSRANSLDALMPSRSGFEAATLTQVLHASRCSALKC
jgi:hypothetical protein